MAFGDDIRGLNQDAQLDQAIEGLRRFTALIAAYREQLLARGVPPEDALALTLGYQAAMLRQVRENS